MERLTRPCKDTENGKYISYTAGTYIGIYPDCTLGQVVEKLAYYEDLEEQGRLVTLPCKVGDSFFTFARVCLCPEDENGCDTYGGCDACPYQSYEIAEWKFKSVVSILNSEPKFGKTMFLTREEAEAAINKKVALRGNYEIS